MPLAGRLVPLPSILTLKYRPINTAQDDCQKRNTKVELGEKEIRREFFMVDTWTRCGAMGRNKAGYLRLLF